MPARPSALATRGGTRVVLVAERETWAPSANRETDARTAITRGLADYIADLRVAVPGGREAVFNQVLDTWPDPETRIDFPAALVQAGTAQYDAARFQPTLHKNHRLPDGRWLRQLSELVLPVEIVAWAADVKMRAHLVAMLEQALVPGEESYGLVLELPHYYNQRAVVELRSLRYDDSDDAAMRHHRVAVLACEGRVSVVRPVELPEAARPKLGLGVADQTEPRVALGAIVLEGARS